MSRDPAEPAAWPFALLFIAQSILFVQAAGHGSIEFFTATGTQLRVALALVGYGMAYPFLNLLAGHAYPATPTFGVPCPTTLLTIGLFASVRQALPLSLIIIPALWGLIGGSAAFLMGVWSDYPLLLSGLFFAGMAIRRRARSALVAR